MSKNASVPDGLSLSRPVASVKLLLNDKRYFWHLATLVIIADIVLTQLVIHFVPCTQLRPLLRMGGFAHNDFIDTEIDFTTYMRQIDVYITGELDYSMLKGPSGPLVYALSCFHARHIPC